MSSEIEEVPMKKDFQNKLLATWLRQGEYRKHTKVSHSAHQSVAEQGLGPSAKSRVNKNWNCKLEPSFWNFKYLEMQKQCYMYIYISLSLCVCGIVV